MTVKIQFFSAEQVRAFVRMTSRFDEPMRLTSGRYAVNGKSILGIFSLDLAHPVTLEIDENTVFSEKTNLLKALENFIVQ